jgi:hypothetical protein
MTDRRRFIHLAVGLAAALGGTGVQAPGHRRRSRSASSCR